MSIVQARSRHRHVARILEIIGRPSVTVECPCLAVTVGLPGSGKSTFARRLAAETGAVVLESDALRRELFGEPSYSADESKQLFQAMYRSAKMLLQRGAPVVIDATNLKESDRVPAYKLARETGAPLILLHFVAPESAIVERLARRAAGGDPEDRSTAGRAVYERMIETEEPIRRDHLRIDTADGHATESALREVVQAMQAAESEIIGDRMSGATDGGGSNS